MRRWGFRMDIKEVELAKENMLRVMVKPKFRVMGEGHFKRTAAEQETENRGMRKGKMSER